AGEARSSGACLALLYATSKEELYFDTALHPEQLAAVLDAVTPLQLDPAGSLTPAAGERSDPRVVQRNAFAGRDVLASFAQEAGLAFIDPTAALRQSLLGGVDPFMTYDSHWNELGHILIAQAAAQTLRSAACPLCCFTRCATSSSSAAWPACIGFCRGRPGARPGCWP